MGTIKIQYVEANPKDSQCDNYLFEIPLTRVINNIYVNHKLLAILEDLYTRGPLQRNIFRQSSKGSENDDVVQLIKYSPVIPLKEHNVLVVSTAFKRYLRSLPVCVLDARLYPKWAACIKRTNPVKKIESFKKVVAQLHPSHVTMLKLVVCILRRIAQNSPQNKMDECSLAICVGASLFVPDSSKNLCVVSKTMAKCVEFMLINAVELFGTNIDSALTSVTTRRARIRDTLRKMRRSISLNIYRELNPRESDEISSSEDVRRSETSDLVPDRTSAENISSREGPSDGSDSIAHYYNMSALYSTGSKLSSKTITEEKV